MVGLARRGRTCMPRWGGAMARFSRGGLASKSGLHAVLGRRQSSVTASLAHRDRVVPADLRVAKGGGGGHGLRAARRRGLARLEGWSEKERKKKKRNKHNFTCVPANGAMAAAGLAGLRGEARWRGGGFENPACGEKRSLQWSEKKRKKEEKNITLFVPANAGNGGDGCGG